MNKTVFMITFMTLALLTGCGNVQKEQIEDDDHGLETVVGISETDEMTTEDFTEVSTVESDEKTGKVTDHIWSREKSESVTINLDFSLEDGKHELFIPEYSDDAAIEYRKDGETVCTISEKLPYAITEVKACDFTFDGVIDLIIFGMDGFSNERFWLYNGCAPWYEGDTFNFSDAEDIKKVVNRDLSEEYNAESIEKLITNSAENGSFSSYNEAYKAVIQFEELTGSDDSYKYNLVYLNEDDEPELVEDAGALMGLTVYSFSNGTVTRPMVNCSYGVGGCVNYEYAPYKNILRTFGHSMEEYGNTLYTIKDNMLTYLYSDSSPYESSETSYTNNTDEKLTDKELEDRVKELNSYPFEELFGEYTKEEILAKL